MSACRTCAFLRPAFWRLARATANMSRLSSMPQACTLRPASSSRMRPVPVPRSRTKSNFAVPSIARNAASTSASCTCSERSFCHCAALAAKYFDANCWRWTRMISRRDKSSRKRSSWPGNISTSARDKAPPRPSSRKRNKTQLPSLWRVISPASVMSLRWRDTRGWLCSKIWVSSVTFISPCDKANRMRSRVISATAFNPASNSSIRQFHAISKIYINISLYSLQSKAVFG